MTEDFLAYCTKAVVAIEVYEERSKDATKNDNEDSSQHQTRTGTFDFNSLVDICELDYDGAWVPVPAQSEITSLDTYDKLYRLRHGQQRRMVITVSPNYGVTFKNLGEEPPAFVPQSCQSLKIGRLRLVQPPEGENSRQAPETGEIDEEDVLNCKITTQSLASGSLVITTDWLATDYTSDLLRKRTPPGARILVWLELELKFSTKNFTVKFEKELAVKIHSRDSEFSTTQ